MLRLCLANCSKTFCLLGSLLLVLGPGIALGEETAPQLIGAPVLKDPMSLPLLQPGVRLVGTDSRDVNGGNNDGFGATYSYLYKDGDEYVLFEEEGPGCVYVVRTIGHKGDLHVYLDGAQEPSYSIPFLEMNKGTRPPFTQPFVAHEDQSHGSSWSYIPIPFQDGCKLTTNEMVPPHFYNILAQKYPVGTVISSFDPSDTADLERAATWWSNPTRLPKPPVPSQTLRGVLTIAPRDAGIVVNQQGPGALLGLKLRFPEGAWGEAAKALLRAYWDHPDLPQVEAPVSTFFGLGCPRAMEVLENADPATFKTKRSEGGRVTPQSLFVGQDDQGWLYCHFPMPYWRSARMFLFNESFHDTLKVEYEVVRTDVPYPWAARWATYSEQEKAEVQQTAGRLSEKVTRIQDEIDQKNKRVTKLRSAYLAMSQEEREKASSTREEHDQLRADIERMRKELKFESAPHGVGYFHAQWRREGSLRDAEDYCLMDVRGRGHYVGCTMTFSSQHQGTPGGAPMARSHLEGDARFYVDDCRSFLGLSTGTEEYFNWGWYDLIKHDKVFQYPIHGYPVHVQSREDYTVMYRFHLGDVANYESAFRFDLEHGPLGRTIADYSSVVYFYHREHPRLACTDELDIGDPASEAKHEYSCQGVTGEPRHTLPYEGSAQLPKTGDGRRDHERAFRDTGKVWTKSCTFTVRLRKDNAGVRLRRRSYYGFQTNGEPAPGHGMATCTDAQRVSVTVDGQGAGDWSVAKGRARATWRDTDFEIPAALTRDKERITIELKAKDGTSWDEYAYWAFSYLD